MTTLLESALQDLDRSTDTLLEVEPSDVLALCAALERRAEAITKIAFLVEEASVRDTGALEHLSAALGRGDEATRRVLRTKRDATEEWTRLSRLLHGLSDPAKPEFDYSG